jgi:hypothetical protein
MVDGWGDNISHKFSLPGDTNLPFAKSAEFSAKFRTRLGCQNCGILPEKCKLLPSGFLAIAVNFLAMPMRFR